MKISFAFSCLSAPNDATEKRWTIKLYIIWIRIATSYWWAKSVWGHESTHDQHEKPKIIFAYVILSFGYDFDYSHFFFAPALVDKQWKTARVMLGHHATICTCKFILHIGRMVYADEREWAKVPKKGWKNGRHTIFFSRFPKHAPFPGHCAWFSFSSYQFPSSVSEMAAKKRTERQQIPNLYLGFFSARLCVCVCGAIFCVYGNFFFIC